MVGDLRMAGDKCWWQADLMRAVVCLQALKDGLVLTDAHSKAESKLGSLILLPHSNPSISSSRLTALLMPWLFAD